MVRTTIFITLLIINAISSITDRQRSWRPRERPSGPRENVRRSASAAWSRSRKGV